VGEKSNLVAINPESAKRMAYAESITNIAASRITKFSDIQFSAFKMKTVFPFFNQAECYEGEGDLSLMDNAGISLPIFGGDEIAHIIAFAPVVDIQSRITPLLSLDKDETVLLFIDLANGQKRLGGSAFTQVINDKSKIPCPDIEAPEILENFFHTIQSLQSEDKILAYHDRSDGGLLITVLEMAFASQCGIRLDISELGLDPFAILFNEELGAVVQIRVEDLDIVLAAFDMVGIACYLLGEPVQSESISILFNNQPIFSQDRVKIQKAWSELNYQIQFVRDNPRCAKKYFERFSTKTDPGLWSKLSFDLDSVSFNFGVKPKIAILREQGVLGDCEMTKAFEKVGFNCVDVHMDNLESGYYKLADFKGIAVCGGFSFSDVLGAGLGWANKILFTECLYAEFHTFFHRLDSFTLGIGNGGQMLALLKTIIPGAELWPNFVKNYSEQFESRLVLVEVQTSPSLFFQDMAGSVIPVPVAHGEGRVEFLHSEQEDKILKEKLVTLRYVDNWGRKTKNYPANPDGSPQGITGFTSKEGRTTILMPHPERAYRSVQYSWHPKDWGIDSPWLKIFQNARKWLS
jgi:phosphoribosylformylglycinamidine synthase